MCELAETTDIPEAEGRFRTALSLKEVGRYDDYARIVEDLHHKGYPPAQVEFATMLIWGNHTKQNQDLGFWLLKKCESLDDGRVFYELGVCYQMGYGTKKDLDRSYDYYIKSLLAGYPRIGCKVQILQLAREALFEKNRARYERVKSMAREGNPLCLAVQGLCLIHGFFEERNCRAAFDLLSQSAERGDSLGQVLLGTCFEAGFGVEKNPERALELYELSAFQGNPEGQCRLGMCHGGGVGTSQDYVEAVRWYRRSAEQGYSSAYIFLGYRYELAQGVPQSVKEAFNLYMLSAKQGDPAGQRAVGNWLMCGSPFLAKNPTEASKWHKLAEEGGNRG